MNENDVFVDVAEGRLRGQRTAFGAQFLGVPYAAPPFDDLRMLPPSSVAPWIGDRDALAFGPTVPKAPSPPPYDVLTPDPSIAGTDCLNLNVWTPHTSAGLLPVFVWIHGGAFINGSGAVPQHEGASFARDGIVCVTINYRLGVDGFLDVGDEFANIGILDQIAALHWVQRNIAAFGGDPDRVTVGGQSAGAMSVGILMASPLAAGLFSGAILQSGAAHHAISRAAATVVTEVLAAHLGIAATRDAFRSAPIHAMLESQAALFVELQSAPDPSRWGEVAFNLMPLEPVIDGTVIPTMPIEGIANGAGATVDVLLGSTTDENLLFMAPTGAIDFVDAEMVQMMAAMYGFADPAALVDLYSKSRPDASPGHLLAAIMTDYFFRIPAIRLAEARAGTVGSTYMYEFAWRSKALDGVLGACHSLDIPFVFDTLDHPDSAALTGRDAPQALADEVHGAWVRFIRDRAPGWPQYDAELRTTMHFDVESAVVNDSRAEERENWAGRR